MHSLCSHHVLIVIELNIMSYGSMFSHMHSSKDDDIGYRQSSRHQDEMPGYSPKYSASGDIVIVQIVTMAHICYGVGTLMVH